MDRAQLLKEIKDTRTYIERTLSVFNESDAGYTPAPGTYTVAQHVAHVAHSCDWMLAGFFGSGWDMNFAAHDADARAVSNLTEAKQMLSDSFSRLAAKVESLTDEELQAITPDDDPIMPSAPKSNLIIGLADHTAHHRGALTVYARMLGKVAPMPYM